MTRVPPKNLAHSGLRYGMAQACEHRGEALAGALARAFTAAVPCTGNAGCVEYSGRLLFARAAVPQRKSERVDP